MVKAGSILAADFGSVHTRVVLLDVVDGEYRIVARDEGLTTRGYPDDDVSIGLRQIVSHMGEVTGRVFYNSLGRIITPEDESRRGVDTFITTTSAGRPIRAVMVGLMPDISLLTALRAISSAYVEPVVQIHLRDGLNAEARLNAILLGRPDLIFISGGTEGGAENALLEILDVVRLAVRITDPTLRPTIIYAGNTALHDKVKELFEELTTLLISSNNIRPTMSEETFETVLVELSKAYDAHRESHGDSFLSVGEMSSTGVLPTALSYATVAQYFAEISGGNVLTADIGSTSSVLVGAFGGHISTRISTTTGLGHSANTLLQEVGMEAATDWLPFYPEPGELRNYTLNKALRPSTVPMTLRELYLEQALLRAGLRQMLQSARELWPEVADIGLLPPVKMVIAGGAALTSSGHPAYNMLLIADCLQPTGVTEIKTDPYGLLPAMGAMARFNSEAAVQLVEGDGLEHLGTLISVDGQPSPDRVVAKIKITTEDGETADTELRGGHLLSLPLPPDISLNIRIHTVGGNTISGRRNLNLTLSGGSAGIVLDARGRVFLPPKTVAERAHWMPQWVNEATDDPLIPIPDDWLIAPDAAPLVEVRTSASKPATKPKAPMDIGELAGLDGGDEADDFFDMIEGEAAGDEEEEFDLRDLLE